MHCRHSCATDAGILLEQRSHQPSSGVAVLSTRTEGISLVYLWYQPVARLIPVIPSGPGGQTGAGLDAGHDALLVLALEAALLVVLRRVRLRARHHSPSTRRWKRVTT
jgi:hypothetical protein